MLRKKSLNKNEEFNGFSEIKISPHFRLWFLNIYQESQIHSKMKKSLYLELKNLISVSNNIYLNKNLSQHYSKIFKLSNKYKVLNLKFPHYKTFDISESEKNIYIFKDFNNNLFSFVNKDCLKIIKYKKLDNLVIKIENENEFLELQRLSHDLGYFWENETSIRIKKYEENKRFLSISCGKLKHLNDDNVVEKSISFSDFSANYGFDIESYEVIEYKK